MTITIPCTLISGLIGLVIFVAGMVVGMMLAGYFLEIDE